MMKNQYKIDKKEMLSWAKELHLYGASNIILFSLWALVGVIGITMLIILAINGGEFLKWYLAVIFVILSVFKLFFSRFVVLSRRYKMFSQTYGVDAWLRTTEFTDDEIILTDHNSVSKFRYESIKKVKEKGNLVIIYMNNNLALRLYKDAFIEGASWEECKKKIESMRI